MDAVRFHELREQAAALYQSQPKDGKANISLDAIFIAICSESARPSADQDSAATPSIEAMPGRQQPPAKWFTDTLNLLKGKGEAVTIGRFLLYANRFPVKRMDQVNAARWLRDAGYIPRKTGGNLVFDL